MRNGARMMLGLRSATPHPQSVRLGAALPLSGIRIPASCDWQSES